MNSQLYISTISPYHAQVCPEGPLNRPASNLYREISRNLQPPAQGLHTSFAIEVVKYIQHFHRFDYKPFLGAPASFSLIIDIHPENSFEEPGFSLTYTFPDQLPKYYVRWNYLPCVIPHFLHQALISCAQLSDLPIHHLVQEVTNWWGHLLLSQLVLTQHLHLSIQNPYLPHHLQSPLTHTQHPRPPSDPLESPDEYIQALPLTSSSSATKSLTSAPNDSPVLTNSSSSLRSMPITS